VLYKPALEHSIYHRLNQQAMNNPFDFGANLFCFILCHSCLKWGWCCFNLHWSRL